MIFNIHRAIQHKIKTLYGRHKYIRAMTARQTRKNEAVLADLRSNGSLDNIEHAVEQGWDMAVFMMPDGRFDFEIERALYSRFPWLVFSTNYSHQEGSWAVKIELDGIPKP